jgi:hypothetical protein
MEIFLGKMADIKVKEGFGGVFQGFRVFFVEWYINLITLRH